MMPSENLHFVRPILHYAFSVFASSRASRLCNHPYPRASVAI
jgi:hypothetical protein